MHTMHASDGSVCMFWLRCCHHLLYPTLYTNVCGFPLPCSGCCKNMSRVSQAGRRVPRRMAGEWSGMAGSCCEEDGLVYVLQFHAQGWFCQAGFVYVLKFHAPGLVSSFLANFLWQAFYPHENRCTSKHSKIYKWLELIESLHLQSFTSGLQLLLGFPLMRKNFACRPGTSPKPS